MKFVKESIIRAAPERVFAFHELPDAILRLTPPWENAKIIAAWRHRHIVLPHAQGAVLRDEIEFEPPFWIFGRLAAPFAVLPKLEKMFEYRHAVTKKWCEEEN
jgi:ligand-binding SRPBCC domain-containing protein